MHEGEEYIDEMIWGENEVVSPLRRWLYGVMARLPNNGKGPQILRSASMRRDVRRDRTRFLPTPKKGSVRGRSLRASELDLDRLSASIFFSWMWLTRYEHYHGTPYCDIYLEEPTKATGLREEE